MLPFWSVDLTGDDFADNGLVIYPAVLGKTDSCATCGLCFNSRIDIGVPDH
jgi:hypothetical protein